MSKKQLFVVLAAIAVTGFLICMALEEQRKELLNAIQAAKSEEESEFRDRLELTDALGRDTFARMSEIQLRNQLIKVSGEQLENLDNPEPYVTKALICEALTRFVEEPEHLWDRAAHHYEEAIEQWRKIVDRDDELKEWALRRIAILHLYRGDALLKAGKTDEAQLSFKEAAANPEMQERAEKALAKLE